MNAPQWLTVMALAMAPVPICEWAKSVGRREKTAEAREAAIK